jgi:hypothetical protein
MLRGHDYPLCILPFDRRYRQLVDIFEKAAAL